MEIKAVQYSAKQTAYIKLKTAGFFKILTSISCYTFQMALPVRRPYLNIEHFAALKLYRNRGSKTLPE